MSTAVNGAHLEALGDGSFRVSGTLDARTVAAVLEEGEARFGNGSPVQVDLAGVTHSDSAGLALLIEWLRQARLRGQQIRYANVPKQIEALATISEVADLLKAD